MEGGVEAGDGGHLGPGLADRSEGLERGRVVERGEVTEPGEGFERGVVDDDGLVEDLAASCRLDASAAVPSH